ncbi:MAG: hypothetical protein JWM53_3194 [bacterium]|nr:hypothetical protein [bacterium]
MRSFFDSAVRSSNSPANALQSVDAHDSNDFVCLQPQGGVENCYVPAAFGAVGRATPPLRTAVCKRCTLGFP